MDKLLSISDVLEVMEPYRFTHAMLRRLCDSEIVVPAEGGGGKGDHRKFSLMQCVGLTIALTVKNSHRSCSDAYIGTIVSSFGRVSEVWLLEKFEEGRTHLMDCPDKPRLITEGQAGNGLLVNIEPLYRSVKEKVLEIRERLEPFNGGRVRGLAGSVNKSR